MMKCFFVCFGRLGGSSLAKPRDREQTRSHQELQHAVLLTGLLGLALAARAAPVAFDFSAVEARARNLAAQPYVAPAENLPAWMQKLNYEEHRGIQFAKDHALWRKEQLPFRVQFFH